MRECALGDQAALAALYDETSRLVYSVALQLLTNTADSEEVTMDVYRQVWREAGRYDEGRSSVGGWLCMLARSRAIDRIRLRRRHANQQALTEAYTFPAHDPSPESGALEKQAQGRLKTAVTLLPQDQRKAVEMAFFSGMSHTEVALALGEPLGTIKTRIRLGMLKLKELLEGVA